MFPVVTKAGGMCMASVPDVCKTPTPGGPVPIPYPNLAQNAMATGTTVRVKIQNMPVLHKGSEIPMSNGDEAGVAGGVISGMNMGKVSHRMGVPTFKVEGQEVVNLMKPTAHNGANANAPVGMQTVPSQAVVLIAG